MDYTYDFNYSMQLQSMPKAVVPASDQEKMFLGAARELVEGEVFVAREVREFIKLLIRQKIFSRMGCLLLEIAEMEFMDSSLKNRGRLEERRGELCEQIGEMNLVLGREKEYYTNVIVLVLTLVLTRLTRGKHQEETDRLKMFHLINWEVRGQHSTNAFYQTLEKDLLFQARVDMFLQGKIAKKKATVVDLKNSLSFKQMQGSLQMRNKMPTNGFAIAMSKENLNVQNTMLSGLLSFRKKSQKNVKERKPSIFEKVNIRK